MKKEEWEEAATGANTETEVETETEAIVLKTLEVMGETKIALQTILGFSLREPLN